MFHYFPGHHHDSILGVCDAHRLTAWNIDVWRDGILLATAISLTEARQMVRNGSARVISENSIEEIEKR